MRHILASLAFVSLPLISACQQADALAGAAPVQAAPAPVSLAGEYRVAAIDGSEVGGGIGIALTVTERQIWFDPRCAGFSWSYSYADGALTTERPEKPNADDGSLVARPVRPVCRIAVHPEQQRLAEALDAVTTATTTPSNALELSGPGHSVTLFTQ